jgi:hypothetical protein
MLKSKMKNNLCLDDGGGQTAAATKFTVWTCDSKNINQLFAYEASTQLIRSANKLGLCVDNGGTSSPGGAKLHLYGCDQNNGKLFTALEASSI